MFKKVARLKPGIIKNDSQGNLIDINTRDGIQGKLEINQTITLETSTKESTQENLEIMVTTYIKLAPATSGKPSIANWVIKKGNKSKSHLV